ncbi:Leucine-rich repeat (LRR) protein [Geosmithia morbida]|uniref:Leucine-rich repeat (LRR) protein n=1 Tax=Geosmithia morbida TaxID=1094350 RepID=A0A9P4YTD4_9HYPO|nr:Leucine-rich repeat (LRR) protein [Geosmithia morbida]KAF4122753.1 Leucine-rich repeat (LRR) protein [Geosmithia morbida]
MEGSSTPSRKSGIARPTSRLPVPSSAIPRPSTTTAPTPGRAASVRSKPSRDSLSGGVTAGGLSSARAPLPRIPPSRGLRSTASIDQLRPSTTTGRRGAPPPSLRNVASRDRLSSSSGRTSRSSLPPQSPYTPQSPGFGPSATTPHRTRSTAAVPQTDDAIVRKRTAGLSRRSSALFSDDAFREDDLAPEDGSDALSVQLTPSKSRMSLAERTVETLASIPPSPAARRKSSAFYDQSPYRSLSRPRSRADSSASRPGSAHNSDGSSRVPSRARSNSRPGSSSGTIDPLQLNFRASTTSSFKTSLATITGTPPNVPSVRKVASRASLGGPPTSRMPPSTPSQAPRKPYGALGSSAAGGSRSLADRPAKPPASSGALFKNPSLSAIDAAATGDSGSWDSTIAPAAANTDQADEIVSPRVLSSRKSSAALRDQIAKARAAKRAAAATVQEERSAGRDGGVDSDIGEAAPIVPGDDSFDFGMSHDDPFNLNKGVDPGKKVLEEKVAAARTTGRLNIAALGLKEIPAEVMNMYDMAGNGGSWAESVDLTRLIAADNELEKLEDAAFPDVYPGIASADFFAGGDDEAAAQGSIFGGLETMDLHNNLLADVPLGFRRLQHMTSLNLTSNRLSNGSIDIISQMTSLRDLKLAKNKFSGPLNPDLTKLASLEILDLRENDVSALPPNMGDMPRLRVLNLNENSLESLPFAELARLPLTDLQVRKNKLSGTLIEDPIGALAQLQTLDVSANRLTSLVPLGTEISFPVLHALSLSMNRLQGLPDMATWTSLLTLMVDENNISDIPSSFTTLEKLRHADFSSNDVRVVPPEVARMDNLTVLRLSGNPLRDKKFASISTDEVKDILAARLEPPPPYDEPPVAEVIQPTMSGFAADAKAFPDGGDDSHSDMDAFATPPTSAPHSPAHSRVNSGVDAVRSRSTTVSNSQQMWPVKQGGVLDRSRTESSSLNAAIVAKVAAGHKVRQVMLQYNSFSSIPTPLVSFAETLSVLSLAGNQLAGSTYLTEPMDLPSLQELNLSSNRITSLEPLGQHLRAPSLEKLDVSVNRISALPTWSLRQTFPQLKILLASNNQIADLEPEMIRGLKIVDISSNDIGRLNPKIGLLGGSAGLERLELSGNRFRAPRWDVLSRGTEATLQWLRGRVPADDMAEWKRENGEEDDFADVD